MMTFDFCYDRTPSSVFTELTCRLTFFGAETLHSHSQGLIFLHDYPHTHRTSNLFPFPSLSFIFVFPPVPSYPELEPLFLCPTLSLTSSSKTSNSNILTIPFTSISPRSIGNLFSWGPVATDSYYHRETRFAHGPLSNITVRQPMEHIKALRKMSVNIPIIIGQGILCLLEWFIG